MAKRYTGGWVKMWRNAIEGDLPDNIFLWGLWHWLLYTAVWKPTKVLWNGKQREIQPGMVVMGIKEISERWGCNRQTIWKWLNYLHDTQRITFESCTRGTLVTICNWDVYQNSEIEAFTPDRHEVDTAITPDTHEIDTAITRSSTYEESTIKKEELRKKKLKDDFEISDNESHEISVVPAHAEVSQQSLSFRNAPPANPNGKHSDSLSPNVGRFIGTYVKAYQARYGKGTRPDLSGKVQGQLKLFLKDVPIDRACNLIEVYLQLDGEKSWFKTKGHDFITFKENLNPIGIALDTGAESQSKLNWANIWGEDDYEQAALSERNESTY